jgi:Oxysterol-binding protein
MSLLLCVCVYICVCVCVCDLCALLRCCCCSHHPPITSWEVLGPNKCYHFYGYGEWTVGFRGNSVKGHQTGPNFIVFEDGTKISWNLPESWCRGVMFGDRIIEYMGEVIFEDKKNDIKLSLVIAPSAKDGFFSFKVCLLSVWSGVSCRC